MSECYDAGPHLHCPDGHDMFGTLERLTGYALVDFCVLDGRVFHTPAGDTTIWWDEQETTKAEDGSDALGLPRRSRVAGDGARRRARRPRLVLAGGPRAIARGISGSSLSLMSGRPGAASDGTGSLHVR